MKKRCILTFALTLSAVLFSAVPVWGQTFTDVASSGTQKHWGYSYVEEAASLGIVHGYTDGTFRPDREVSCQEAMTMICNTLDAAGCEIADSSFTVHRSDHSTDGITDHSTDGITDYSTGGITDHSTDGITNHSTDDITDHSTDGITDHSTDGITDYSTDDITDHSTDGITDHSTDDFTDRWTDVLNRLGFADWSAAFAARLLEQGYATEKDFLRATAETAAQRQLIGAWLSRAIGLPAAPLCPCSAFSDSNIVRTDFIGEIDGMKRYGVMNGYTDGSLRPAGSVTRAEFATMCVNTLRILKGLPSSSKKAFLKDSLFLAYGTIAVCSDSAREVKITESGKDSLYRIPENATILIDGVKSDFQSLSSLAGKNLAISCLYGFDSQLIIQTHSAVQYGTLSSVAAAGNFCLLDISLSDGLSVCCVLEVGKVPAGLSAGNQISFISEGAHILELINITTSR